MERFALFLSKGHFKSAKRELINNVAVEGVLTQVFYDAQLDFVTDYITNNY